MAQFPEELREALARLVAGRTQRGPLVFGVAGGVAAGKSTFAHALSNELSTSLNNPHVEIIATDGFLLPNRILAERNLSLRKGFPESYDFAALVSALKVLKQGGTSSVPVYSHVSYDVDPEKRHEVGHPEYLILDGLHLGRAKLQEDGTRLIDGLIYLDAQEGDIRRWFESRLRALMTAGRSDPASFYYGFRQMDDLAVEQFIERVWADINLPNLRGHIVKDREAADIVVQKGPNHELRRVVVRAVC